MPNPGLGVTTGVDLPVGTVVAFAGKISSSSSDSPSAYITNIEALGWMLCDGKSLEVSQYPDLFAVLGYLYGGQIDKLHIFRVLAVVAKSIAGYFKAVPK
jgi:hypothetical protein